MHGETICLLNDSFPPVIDGVANAVVNYARNIGRCGGRALVATPTVHGADDSGFDFPVLRYPSIDTRRLLGYVAGYPFSPEIAARLQEERPVLLHTHCPISSCMLARSLRETLDVPLVLTYHTKFDIDIAKALHGRLLQAGVLRALAQNIEACDEVWVVSEGAGENLRSIGYRGDYTVMQNGVDIPRGRADAAHIEAVCGAYGLPQDVPVFLFVGRLMWYKGLRILLDALKALDTDFRMVFVGDGADGAAVRAYAESLGLRERCIFTGALSERDAIRAWYSRADLFLFPSTFDTNGLVVREAAACGTATVMVAGSCAAEGVTDGQNGFLIEENAASMAQCLKALCAQRQTMAAVGECASRELYISWEEAVGRACERYETVIDNYRCGRYPKHKKPMDGWFRAQGELMEVLAGAETEWQELRSGADAAQTMLHDDFNTVRRALWERIDRYL